MSDEQEWRAKPIMAGYAINGYYIVRGEEEPIARTIVKDEGYDEEAATLIISALNSAGGKTIDIGNFNIAMLGNGAFWAMFGGLVATNEPWYVVLVTGIAAVSTTTWAAYEMYRIVNKDKK